MLVNIYHGNVISNIGEYEKLESIMWFWKLGKDIKTPYQVLNLVFTYRNMEITKSLILEAEDKYKQFLSIQNMCQTKPNQAKHCDTLVTLMDIFSQLLYFSIERPNRMFPIEKEFPIENGCN